MWPCSGVIYSFEMAGKVENSEWKTEQCFRIEKTKCGCLGWYHEYESRAWQGGRASDGQKLGSEVTPRPEQLCLIETRGTFCLWITCLEFLLCLPARPEPRRGRMANPTDDQKLCKNIHQRPPLPFLMDLFWGSQFHFSFYMEFISISSYISSCMCAKSFPSRLTLCHPMDCSLLGSSVHGILQARTLEWVDHDLLQGIFPTHGSNSCLLLTSPLLHWQVGSLPLAPPGKPYISSRIVPIPSSIACFTVYQIPVVTVHN